MVDVVHEPIDDDQAEMHIWSPADLLWFCIRACDFFLTFSVKFKCPTTVDGPRSRVLWRGSLFFIKSRRSSWTWSVTKVKTILIKTIFLPCSLRWYCPHTQRKSIRPPPLLSSLYGTQREEYVGNVPISPLSTPFLASTAPLTIFNWQNFNV